MTSTSLDGLLAELRRLDVKLSVSGDRLSCDAPKGVLTVSLQSEIKSRKAELIEFLRSLDAPALPPLRPAARNGEIPLSFAQEGSWFIDQVQPGQPFNILLVSRVQGSLDWPSLRAALDEISRRHAALRTNFPAVDGRPAQVIHDDRVIPLSVIDLEHLSAEDRDREILRRLDRLAQHSFDLAAEPLAQASVYRLADEDHVLAVVIHHIVFDGYSLAIFVREFAALYAAHRAGAKASLPATQIEYADYAIWQRELLNPEFVEAQLHYWKRQLADHPAGLELAADRRTTSDQLYCGEVATLPMPVGLGSQLRRLAQAEGVTLFMLLLAAFKTLLMRCSEQEDIVVGTPLANRSQPEMSNVIGFCVNLLALRTDLSGNPSFRELLRREREVCLGAYSHQDLPFGILVRELQPLRDVRQSPIFQVQFALHDTQTYTVSFPGLKAAPLFDSDRFADELQKLATKAQPAADHLFLNIYDSGDRLAAVMHYRNDMFEAESIRRMLRRLQGLLEAVIADPDLRLWDISLLATEDRTQLLRDWSIGGPPFPTGVCVHELFEAQAALTPDAPAVIVPSTEQRAEERLSYGELNRRANRLAHYLRRAGVGCESRVAICLERSLETMIAVWGVLKAGAAFVPIDPGYGHERLRYMLEDSHAQVVLSRQGTLSEFPDAGPRVILLDQEQAAIARESEANPAVKPSDLSLAYVVYTSGSTGRPKGVMVAHRSLANAYRAWEQDYLLRETRRHLQMASFSFDVFVGDLTRAHCCGAALVLCPRESLLLPEELCSILRDYEIDCAEFVPAVVRSLLEHLAASGDRLRGLRLVAVGSDSWHSAEYRQLQAAVGSATRVINSYGVAEATIDSTCFEDHGASLASGPLPIGRPFVGSEVYVLDRFLQPTPPGVPGELYLGGAGLARGYLDRPQLTAERFIPHPFSDRPGERLYRTGDRARFLAEGNLEFIGRADNQIKIRGFRIEPGEIEAVLGEHPHVQQAVVVAHGEHTGERRLVAYLTAKTGEELAEADVRRFLVEKLPGHMVPAMFVILEQFPLSANGKINRRALPAPSALTASLAAQYAPPRNITEMALARLWAHTLDVERVGIHDDFFALGGHSLLAARLVARIRSELKIELPLRALFEHLSIAALAPVVDAARLASAALLPAIVPARRDQRLPLSFAQEGAWFVEQLQPGTPFHIPLVLRVRGSLDPAAIERALELVIARHEVLRTHFEEVEGEPFQVVVPSLAVPFAIIDLSDLPDASRERELVRRLVRAAAQPFDFARGPMLRMIVYRLNADEHVLFFNVHHIVFDGYSVNVFARDLAACYEACRSSVAVELPELPVQYADYAVWQRQVLSGEFLESQIEYWRRQLASPTSLEIATSRRRLSSQLFQGEVATVILSAELTAQLRALSQREGATLFMLLLAAFKLLLNRYSGQDDIIVGTPVANRNQPELAGMIGFCVNVLALRTDLSGNPAFRELLERVRTVCLDAYSHQEVPFGLLVQRLRPDRYMTDSPFFQVSFSLLDARAGQVQLPADVNLSTDVDLDILREELQVFQADVSPATDYLFLQMVDGGTNLAAVMQHRSDLDPEMIQRMMTHFVTLLEGITANPGAALAEIPLLASDEQTNLLTKSSGNSQEQPHAGCIQQLFEAQAAQTPEAIAIIDPAHEGKNERRLTYAELNSRANQLAGYLRSLGVQAESRVGICLDRSPEMIVAVWGVLKAGAAFVPLDPSYGQERLSYMLRDAGVAVVICTRESLVGPLDGLRVVRLDDDQAAIAQQSIANLGPTASDDGLAYLVYTSGSTGRPKGVMVSHRSLVNAYRGWETDYELRQTCRHLQMASFSFDVFVGDLVRALCSGAALVLCPRETLLMPRQLDSLLRRYEVDCAEFVPAVVRLLIEHLEQTDQRLDFFKLLLVGSDTWHASEYRQLRHLAGEQTRVINSYGVAEATIDSTYYCDAAGSLTDEQMLPMGHPFPGVEVYVLDRHLQLVPLGVAGELYLGGPGLARGYYGRPGLTAERFMPHPFSRRPGERLYRTGDKVRFLPDGNLEFIGRVDRQIKIRGFRIEPGEIEAVLGEHPDVHQAIVADFATPTGDKGLVAYVVPAEGAALDEAPLREFAGGKLPGHMIPAVFVLLEKFPMTPGGKIDRRALPQPTGQRLEQAKYQPPQSPVEVQLARLWSDVLGVERVGVHDNFFALGGHSLSAARLASRVRTELGIDLPLRALFEHPQIASLARELENLQQADSQVALPPEIVAIQPRGAQPPLFLLHAADGHVVAYVDLVRHLDPGLPVYGVQHPGLTAADDADASLTELATRYANAIRQVQAEGPYRLAGWSLGGVLAYETARQLEQQGGQVALVALLDSWAWNAESGQREHALARHRAEAHFGISLEEFLAFSPQEQWDFLLARAKLSAGESDDVLLLERVAQGFGMSIGHLLFMLEETLPADVDQPWTPLLDAARRKHGRPSEPELVSLRGQLRVAQGLVVALGRHTFFPYAGEVTLLRINQAQRKDDALQGWGHLAASVHVHHAPGQHFTMLKDPHARRIASMLNDCLLPSKEDPRPARPASG